LPEIARPTIPVPNTPILTWVLLLPALHLPLAGASPAAGKAVAMKISRLAIPVTVAALVAAAPAVAAAAEFEGTVRSVNRENRTFRLHDSERGTKRIKVTRNTRFERIDGLRGLHAGMRNVEVVAKRRDGRWVAIEVERSGGGGNHGGDDD
jgi:Domain of unknown function (DUF5666)